MKSEIKIVGTGSLGSALARRLLDCGYPVAAFNRTASKAEALVGYGARVITDVNKVFDDHQSIVIVCLKDADSIISTFAPLSAHSDKQNNKILVMNTSTLGPSESVRVEAFMRTLSVEYVELPVSGGPEGAIQGRLVAYIGPVSDSFRADILDIASLLCHCYSLMKSNYHAQAMKVINNYCEAMNMAVASEAVYFAEKIGLSKDDICKTLPMGRGRSVYMDVLLDKYQRSDHSISFPLDLRVKDLKLVAQMFDDTNVRSFFYSQLSSAYDKALMANHSRVDQSAYLNFFKNYNKN
ncbi:NAD(P)-dependent oxidoreductase [Erwinia psidii]|uniref:NAD(P)-dependent oxidoreductase n=1 Tax=Erwinia psidii TaxID=69224 RepID=A0A3N6S1S4_9GAMM|nr:NAD(P)-binding domain-containing protein [Erwinia psidii]RQM39504.1 NAD(P)-dependent oxidoreductase [Erwinia psidii]